MTQIDLNLLMKALSFAARKHRKQVRKGAEPIPYINHPIAVADLIVRTGSVRDGETIAAALLHDTVEDTKTTFEELEAEFGLAIAKLVAEVTDDKSLPKPERRNSYRMSLFLQSRAEARPCGRSLRPLKELSFPFTCVSRTAVYPMS